MISLSRETETLAERVADAQRLSVEDATRRALEAQARIVGVVLESRRPRDRSPEATAARRARTDRLVAELATMPILDPRCTREIVDDLNAL